MESGDGVTPFAAGHVGHELRQSKPARHFAPLCCGQSGKISAISASSTTSPNLRLKENNVSTISKL